MIDSLQQLTSHTGKLVMAVTYDNAGLQNYTTGASQ